MPIGTVGGTHVRYNFPLDAEYMLQAKLYRTNLEYRARLGLRTSGRIRHRRPARASRLLAVPSISPPFEKPTDTGDAVDARLRVRVPVKAGPHEVTVAFIQGPRVESPTVSSPTSAAPSTTSTGPDSRISSCSQSPVLSMPKVPAIPRAAAASSPAIRRLRRAQSKSLKRSPAAHTANLFPIPT